MDVRRAALERHLRHGVPVSDGFGPELAEETARMYVPAGFIWTNCWRPGGMAGERAGTPTRVSVLTPSVVEVDASATAGVLR